MTTSFPQASRMRLRTGGLTRGGSADSHRQQMTLDQLRRECQGLLRRDKLARSLVKRVQTYVVGDRVGHQQKSSNPDFNRAVEAWASGWLEACELTKGRSVTELCRNAVRSALENGDELWVFTDQRAVQEIEAQRIQNPLGPGMINTRTMRGGIEIDELGRVARYHVAEWIDNQGGAYTQYGTRPIPADQCVHLANPIDDQANVTRPEPGLAALIEDFPAIRHYITDVRAASTMAAMFGLVTKTTAPQDVAALIPGSQVNRSDDLTPSTTKEVELQPGFMMALEPGEDLMQVKPEQPTTVFGDFLSKNLTLMGADVGVPLALWMFDLQGINYSGLRSLMVLAYLEFAVWREWLRKALRKMFRWRLALAIADNEIPGITPGSVPDDWDKSEWIFPPVPMLDPLVQAQADAFAINNGLETHRSIAAQRGYDLDDLFEQLGIERKDKERLGILPIGMPGAVDPNAAKPPPEPSPDAGA